MQSKWILRKSFYMNTHTQRRLHNSSVALVVTCCSKPCQPYDNDVPITLWIFLRQTRWISMQILFTGFRFGCWSHRHNGINVVSPISLSEVWNGRQWHGGCVRADRDDTLFRFKIKNSQQISHMTGSCCWVRSMLS